MPKDMRAVRSRSAFEIYSEEYQLWKFCKRCSFGQNNPEELASYLFTYAWEYYAKNKEQGLPDHQIFAKFTRRAKHEIIKVAREFDHQISVPDNQRGRDWLKNADLVSIDQEDNPDNLFHHYYTHVGIEDYIDRTNAGRVVTPWLFAVVELEKYKFWMLRLIGRLNPSAAAKAVGKSSSVGRKWWGQFCNHYHSYDKTKRMTEQQMRHYIKCYKELRDDKLI
jgi:hypothetical protein